MITIIKQIIFTDKKKDGSPLISKAGAPFKMLHLELPDGRWVSKFYSMSDEQPDIEVGVKYDIRFKENGQYLNLVALFKLPEGDQEADDPELQLI